MLLALAGHQAPRDVVEIDSVSISCCENTHYRSEDQFGQDGPVSLSYRFYTADRSMVFTGDTGPCRALEDLAMGADLLVGELIDPDIVIKRISDKNPEMSKQSLQKMRQHLSEHHLTPEELGGLAANAGVNQLVAVHIPFVTKSAEEDAKYVSRISAKFGGSVTISVDQAAY